MKEKLFKYFKGEFSEKEKTELNKWLAASEENRQCFENMHKLFDAVVLYGDMDIIKGSAVKEKEEEPHPGRRIIKWISRIAATLALVAGAFALSYTGIQKSLTAKQTEITVPAGQRINITLEDGTEVMLNSGSSLKYPVLFSKDSRIVELTGEARFKVRPSSGRNFVVKTFAADVKVLGTEFNVCVDQENNSFSTALFEGSVEVTAGGRSIELTPNHTLSIVNGRVEMLHTIPPQAASWSEGYIDITGLTDKELIRTIEKAYGVDIIIDGGTAPELNNISGKIRISDGVEHAVKVIRHIAGFDYTRDSEGNIHIRYNN